MSKVIIPRLAIALAIIAANWAGMYILTRQTVAKPSEVPAEALSQFPLQLGPWVGEDVPIDSNIYKHSTAAAMLNRLYRDPLGDPVTVNIGIWKEVDTTIVPHTPEVCYPSAGWTMIDKSDISIPLTEQHLVPARLLRYERQGRQVLVLFWCHLGDRVAVDSNGVRAALIALRSPGQSSIPTAVRVTLATPTSRVGRDDVELRLRNFAQLIMEQSSGLR
jgi:EpsI family protein